MRSPFGCDQFGLKRDRFDITAGGLRDFIDNLPQRYRVSFIYSIAEKKLVISKVTVGHSNIGREFFVDCPKEELVAGVIAFDKRSSYLDVEIVWFSGLAGEVPIDKSEIFKTQLIAMLHEIGYCFLENICDDQAFTSLRFRHEQL